MSAVYDNWERLVAATLKKQQYRELALADSRDNSFSSSESSSCLSFTSFGSSSGLAFECSGPSFKFFHSSYGSDSFGIERTINLAIRLIDVAKIWRRPVSFNQKCAKLVSKALDLKKLVEELQNMKDPPYDRPTKWIMYDTEQNLSKGRNVFSVATIDSLVSLLERSIGNISWLLHGSEYSGVPPLAAHKPVLCRMWELIAILRTGSGKDQCDAADELIASSKHVCDLYTKLIVEEGGVRALLRLYKEGNSEGKEKAFDLIRMLAKNPPRFCNGWEVALLKRDPQELCHIMELISDLRRAWISEDGPCRTTESLADLVRQDNVFGLFMVAEGAMEPLLNLVKTKKSEWRESARKAIAQLQTSGSLPEIEEWFGVFDRRA